MHLKLLLWKVQLDRVFFWRDHISACWITYPALVLYGVYSRKPKQQVTFEIGLAVRGREKLRVHKTVREGGNRLAVLFLDSER